MFQELYICSTMLKKYSISIAWSILSVWVFYTLFHTVLAVFELNMHHTIVQHQLKHHKEKKTIELTIFMCDKNFVRINKKEFVWQNEWYDIVSISEKDGIYHIVAYPDKKEEKLRKNLAQAIEQNQEKSEKGKHTQKFELKESYTNTILYLFNSTYSLVDYYQPEFRMQDGILTLPCPPPKITA